MYIDLRNLFWPQVKIVLNNIEDKRVFNYFPKFFFSVEISCKQYLIANLLSDVSGI